MEFNLGSATSWLCDLGLGALPVSALVSLGLPGGTGGKGPVYACRRPGFDPWVGKIPLEEEMATHCSILAWRILWTEEPGGLQSTGLQRFGHY